MKKMRHKERGLKFMNKKQKQLFEALKVIDISTAILEETLEVAKALSKKDIKLVVDKFSEEIIEFNKDELYTNSYNFEYYANRIIDEIVRKINN